MKSRYHDLQQTVLEKMEPMTYELDIFQKNMKKIGVKPLHEQVEYPSCLT